MWFAVFWGGVMLGTIYGVGLAHYIFCDYCRDFPWYVRLMGAFTKPTKGGK